MIDSTELVLVSTFLSDSNPSICELGFGVSEDGVSVRGSLMDSTDDALLDGRALDDFRLLGISFIYGRKKSVMAEF